MKKLFTLILAGSAMSAFCQSTAGLIAHWDMNGTVNDVTGAGHNGHPNNLAPAAGESGIPNTAYYFNGLNSSITVPYLPDLDVTKLSICATVKVTGFYSGPCQANTILTRGTFNTPGAYMCYFDDNQFDGDCSNYDTTKDLFVATFGTNSVMPYSQWQYSPSISENIWYKVVVTFDDTAYKVYVNDSLKSTAFSDTPGAGIGTSTDSLAIGLNIFGSTGPWPFKGIIDDILLYNRVLTDSEIIRYGDTCGTILAQPSPAVVYVGQNAVFTVGASIGTPSYQWQQDMGAGFANLANSAPYSGVTTNTLTITGVIASLNSDHYRCIISNASGCADTSIAALLTATTGIANIPLADQISIFPNPSTNNLHVKLPANNYEGNIQLIDELGKTLSTQNIVSDIANLDLTNVPAGMYFLRIQVNSEVVYKKLLKN